RLDRTDPPPSLSDRHFEVDELRAEDRGCLDAGGDVVRNPGGVVRVERDRDCHLATVRLAHAAYLAHGQSGDANRCTLVEQQACSITHHGDFGDWGEHLLVHPEEHRHQGCDEDQTGGANESASHFFHVSHPETLRVSTDPYSAKLSSMSVKSTATSASRTARPTARPTPAGPPLAV